MADEPLNDSCPGGPATCMDDICRWSQVGWCGKDRADYRDEDDDYGGADE